MRFLVDAQLPRRIARELAAAGHDAIHCLDLPKGNRTPDAEIASVAAREGRVVVTKDQDFVAGHLLNAMPPKLLLISTGNASNATLSRLLSENLTAIHAALRDNDLVELGPTTLTIHG